MIDDLPNVKLQDVELFRTSYYLCDLSSDNKKLIPTHVVLCLSSGRYPVWGIFNFDTGRLIGTTVNRASIEEHRWYKRKVWRRRQASLRVGTVTAMTPYERRVKALQDQVDHTVVGMSRKRA